MQQLLQNAILLQNLTVINKMQWSLQITLFKLIQGLWGWCGGDGNNKAILKKVQHFAFHFDKSVENVKNNGHKSTRKCWIRFSKRFKIGFKFESLKIA